MNRWCIYVEGYTEDDFVKEFLKKEFSKVDIQVYNAKGVKTIDGICRDLKRLVHNFDMVTTMLDFYGFRDGKNFNDDKELEDEIKNKVGTLNLYPYIQKHEFEALIFSDKQVIIDKLKLDGEQKNRLNRIRMNPEDINHNNPPSKRLKNIYSGYGKRIDGISILRDIGFSKMEKSCPKFSLWIRRLREEYQKI